MIANFFQKSKPINFLVLAIALFLIYLLAFFTSIDGQFEYKDLLKNVVMFVVILFTFFLLNFVITKNVLTEDNSYALLFFILGTGMFPIIYVHEKLIIAHFLLLLSFRRMYSLHSAKRINEKIFDSGFWIGVSFLIFNYSMVYLIVLYLAILFFRRENYRTLIIPIVGFCTPVLLFYVYTLYLENTPLFWDKINLVWHWDLSLYMQSKIWIPVLFLTIFTIVAMLLTTQRSISGKQDFKHTWYVLLFHTLISLLLISVVNEKDGSEFLLLAFPCCILLANYVQTIKRQWIKESVLYLFVGVTILSYFL